MKTVYIYDSEQKCLLGEHVCDKDQFSGDYLIPYNSTDAVPPSVTDGEVAVFDAAKNIWNKQSDHRGTWYRPDGSELFIHTLDEDAPNDATREKPAPKTPTLSELKTSLKLQINMSVDQLRASHVSQGQFMSDEYRIAFDEAKAWLADQSKPVPLSISSWAEAAKLSNEDAANSIVETGDKFKRIISQTRAIRLTSRAKIDNAKTTKAANDEFDLFVKELNKIK